MKRVVKVRRSSSPGVLREQEPVRLSMFPDAKPKQPDEIDKIERDDWPCPAAPAALLPEICKSNRLVIFGRKVGQIDTKWKNLGCEDHFYYILAQ